LTWTVVALTGACGRVGYDAGAVGQDGGDANQSDAAPPVPVSSSNLGDAWAAALVPCILDDGSEDPIMGDIPVVDSNVVRFFDGELALAGAPADTVAWAGGRPTVTILWDPNSCGDEAPGSSSMTWDSAGFLVRGASLVDGAFLGEPGLGTDDINMIDANSNGTWGTSVQTADYFAPDDSELATYPNFVQSVARAKDVLVSVAHGQ